MAKNIFGNNAIKSNVEFNFVAAYITQAERYYNTDYNVREPSTDKQAIAEESFVGFLHTTRGEGILIFPDKRITVHKNDLVFLRWRDLIAMITKNSEWDFYCLWFHLNNLTLEFEKVFSLTPPEDERSTIEQIIRLLNNNEYYSLCQANGLGLKLLCELLSNIGANADDSPYRDIIQNAVFQINQRTNEKLTVQELAQMSNVSEKHFRNLFTSYMGMPPKQYIIKTKLEKAAFMLTFSKQNVTQISEELSFLSPAYFINCFKAYYNMTPTQYRKHHSLPSVEKIPSNELEEEIEKEIEE